MEAKPIPKTSKSNRTLLLPETVINALREHLERQKQWKEQLGPLLYHDQGLFFANETGGYLDPGNVNRRYFKPILKKAGLPAIRPYDLRHTRPTLMIINGRDLKLVSQRLGHEDEAFTIKQYHHVIPRLENEAVELFDDIMAGRLSETGGQRSSRRTLEELLGRLDQLLSGSLPPAPQDRGLADLCDTPIPTGDKVIPFKLGSSSKKRSRIPLAH
jgi:hypothetical protein